MANNVLQDLLGDFFIVGMRCQRAAFNHLHPKVTIDNQTSPESRSDRIPTALNPLFSLMFIEVLQNIPGQFIVVFKSLDDPCFSSTDSSRSAIRSIALSNCCKDLLKLSKRCIQRISSVMPISHSEIQCSCKYIQTISKI